MFSLFKSVEKKKHSANQKFLISFFFILKNRNLIFFYEEKSNLVEKLWSIVLIIYVKLFLHNTEIVISTFIVQKSYQFSFQTFFASWRIRSYVCTPTAQTWESGNKSDYEWCTRVNSVPDVAVVHWPSAKYKTRVLSRDVHTYIHPFLLRTFKFSTRRTNVTIISFTKLSFSIYITIEIKYRVLCWNSWNCNCLTERNHYKSIK